MDFSSDVNNITKITNWPQDGDPLLPVSIDTGLAWNIAVTVVYGLATPGVILLFIQDAWRSENFSVGPWYFLFFFRYGEVIMGFCLPKIIAGIRQYSTSYLTTEIPFTIGCTYFWELGFNCIVLGMFRNLYLALKIEKSSLKTFRTFWTFIIPLMTIAGYTIGSTPFQIYLDENISDELLGEKFRTASRLLLGSMMVIMILTLVALACGYALVLVRRKEASSPAMATAIIALPSITLLFPRIISDSLRMWAYHIPSLAELVGAGLVLEFLVVIMWLAVGFLISRWDKWRREERANIISRAKARWQHEIRGAQESVFPSYRDTIEDALARLNKEEMYESSVATIARLKFRLFLREILTSPYSADIRSRIIGSNGYFKRAEIIEVLDLYRKTLDIEACIVAESICVKPCEQNSLFEQIPRPISLEATISVLRWRLEYDQDALEHTGLDNAELAALRLTLLYFGSMDVEVDD